MKKKTKETSWQKKLREDREKKEYEANKTVGQARQELRADIKKEIEEKKKREAKRKLEMELKRLRFEKLQRARRLLGKKDILEGE